jgi:hypothetical protein
MRRAIFIIIFAIFIFGGILQSQKIQHINNGASISDNYVKGNTCAQELLWFPIGSVCGLSFLLFPRKTIKWLIKPLSQNEQKYMLTDVHFSALRFFGLILAVPTFITIQYSPCLSLLQNLFSR